MDLSFIWAVIIGFAIFMYVLLDGFDLGIGILFPFFKNDEDRQVMMSTISPVWDGNETWMVLGGASLYGAFPLAYSTLLPIFYLPIMIMLAALIFRGICIEFFFKAHKSKFIWDYAFFVGSLLAAFSQGLILGTYIGGFDLNRLVQFQSHYYWLSPFSIITGFAVVFGYALLGATWLIIKSTNHLQERAFRMAKKCLLAVAFFLMVVSLWSPFLDPHIQARWFNLHNFFYLLPLPVITTLAILYLFKSLQKKRELAPFIGSLIIFLCSYTGLLISIWPYIIPHHVTIWQAAAPPESQKFILVGTVILLPLLLAYTAYSYWVFRGKVSGVDHIHEGY